MIYFSQQFFIIYYLLTISFVISHSKILFTKLHNDIIKVFPPPPQLNHIWILYSYRYKVSPCHHFHSILRKYFLNKQYRFPPSSKPLFHCHPPPLPRLFAFFPGKRSSRAIGLHPSASLSTFDKCSSSAGHGIRVGPLRRHARIDIDRPGLDLTETKRIWKRCTRECPYDGFKSYESTLGLGYMEILADRSSLTAYVSSRIGDLFTRGSWGRGKK